MWIAYDTNEYGTRISRHACATCGRPFQVCPAIAPHEVEERGWENCLATDCDSYDEARDVDLMLENGAQLETRPPLESN